MLYAFLAASVVASLAGFLAWISNARAASLQTQLDNAAQNHKAALASYELRFAELKKELEARHETSTAPIAGSVTSAINSMSTRD